MDDSSAKSISSSTTILIINYSFFESFLLTFLLNKSCFALFSVMHDWKFKTFMFQSAGLTKQALYCEEYYIGKAARQHELPMNARPEPHDWEGVKVDRVPEHSQRKIKEDTS